MKGKIPVKKILLRMLLVGILVPFWIFLRSVYRDRIGAFGCFDDCFNYMGGYFLVSGKHLYSQIFFNHQPIPAYLSAVIQYLTHPDSLYMLIYQHRMFLIYYAMVWNIFLTLRYGLIGLGFSLLYELTKGYLFGERFLAEGMIVYPLIYLFILFWKTWKEKILVHPVELVVVSILVWLVAFTREPYVPLALFLFGLHVWQTPSNRMRAIMIGVFLLLSAGVIAFHNIGEYWYQVVVINQQIAVASEIAATNLLGQGIFGIFLYPLFIFSGGTWNYFHWIEAGVAVLFFLLLIVNRNDWKKLVFLIFILGLANIRPIKPGVIYYAAFHHVVWYGLFITSVLLLLQDTFLHHKRGFIQWVFAGGYGILVGFSLFSRQSYLYDRVDRATEFTTNFAHVYANGDIVKLLSVPSDTLFLDGQDDLIYWQAQRLSSYTYSWYTSMMPQIPRYRDARMDMFTHQPPAFFYGKCSGSVFDPTTIPLGKAKLYTRLEMKSGPTCLFVLISKLPSISDAQWESVKKYDVQKVILGEKIR